MHRGFPDAPIYTALYDPDNTFPDFAAADIRPGALNRVGLLRRNHRLALPMLAPTFSSMTLDADVVLCSSSGWAHGVHTRGRKVVYCYAPARWLYQSKAYLRGSRPGTRAALRMLRPALVRWDRTAASSADLYVVPSTRARDLVRDAYGIESKILFPPCPIDPAGLQQPVNGLIPGFFLCVSRLLAYKHVDVVIQAFDELRDERLVVVGTGPEEARLRDRAPSNVTFVPRVSDEELRWLYANAQAVIAAAFEDYGLTPLEAAAFGTPCVALRFGGYLDTVRDGETGVLFDQPEPALILAALRRLGDAGLDPIAIRRRAEQFDEPTFLSRLRTLLTTVPLGDAIA
jgi:glycosyltransferase involved in cell wall biosynthesis